jgi:hypothetical protein
MLETEFAEDLIRALEGTLRIGGESFSGPQHSSFILRASYFCQSSQQAVFVVERSMTESKPAGNSRIITGRVSTVIAL